MKNRKNRLLHKVLPLILSLSLAANPIIASATGTDDPAVQSVPQVSVTVTFNDNGDGSTTETTTTNETWHNQEQTGTPTDPQAPPAEGTNVVVDTSTAGSQTTVESTTFIDENNILAESRTVTGSETITTTTTTTNVDIEENQLVTDTTTTTTTVNGEVTSVVTDGETITTGTAGADTVTTDIIPGEWIEGSTPAITGTEETGWTEGTVNYNTEPDRTIDPDAQKTSTDISLSDPLDQTDVKLEMTPGGKDTEKVTATETVETLVKDHIGPIPVPGTKTEPVFDDNGEKIGTKTIVTKEKKDADGNVIGWETTTTTETETETGMSLSKTTPEPASGYQESAPAPTAPILPADITAGEEPVYDNNGNVIGKIITTIENTTDEQGNPIAVVTKTTVINSQKTEHPVPAPIADVVDTPADSFKLPDKPAESITTNANGDVTTVTVQDILDENNVHVGYRTITTVRNSVGTLLSSTTNELYGTTTTITKTTKTDVTGSEVSTNTETTTVERTTYTGQKTTREVELSTERYTQLQKQIDTTKEYQIINVDGELYFIYSAEMGTPYNGTDHSKISDMTSIQPDQSLITSSDSVLAPKDLYNKNETSTGNYGSFAEYHKNTDSYGEYLYKIVGNGVASSLRPATQTGSTSVHQFRLIDKDGNAYYAYCVDFATDIQAGYDYKEDEVDERVPGGYVNNNIDDPVENLTRIALNGYWGTTDGIGSLQAVQQFLKESGYAQTYAIDSTKLTEGQALAATQAAIWKYGNSGSGGIDEGKMLQDGSTDEDIAYVKALYYALLNADGTPVLDADDISGTSITLKNKNDNGTYNTDVGFTLDANDSEIVGDLMVNIMQGTQVVKSARLSGYKDNKDLGNIIKNPDGSYTVKDVVLAEGVTLTLNISGLQESATGVKIYVSEIINNISSQTLIGLTTGNRNVDINVDLEFNAQEPEAALETGSDKKTQIWNTTRTDRRTDIRTDHKTDTYSSTASTMTVREEVNTKVYATVTVTEVVTDQTKTERTWKSEWNQTYYPVDPYNDDYPIPEDDKDPEDKLVIVELIDEEVPLTELTDEMIPLSSIPRTGSTSVPWSLLTLLSAVGLLSLCLTDRKKKA